MKRPLSMLCALCVLSAVVIGARESTAGPDQNTEVVGGLVQGPFGVKTVHRVGNAGSADATVQQTCYDSVGTAFLSNQFLVKIGTKVDIDFSQIIPPSTSLFGHCRYRSNGPVFGVDFMGVPGPQGLWSPGTMFLMGAPFMGGVMKQDGGAYWSSTATWGTFGFYVNATDSSVLFDVFQFSGNGEPFQLPRFNLAPRASLAFPYQPLAGTTSGVVDFSTSGPGGIAGWHIHFNPTTGVAYKVEVAADALAYVRFQFAF